MHAAHPATTSSPARAEAGPWAGYGLPARRLVHRAAFRFSGSLSSGGFNCWVGCFWSRPYLELCLDPSAFSFSALRSHLFSLPSRTSACKESLLLTCRIHKGCAGPDGLNFRDWFVGPLSDWSERPSGEPALLRQSDQVQVKWALHPGASQRPGEWADPDPYRSLCILVEGTLSFFFRPVSERGAEKEYLLDKPGDYVMWEGETEHTWVSHSDSRVITVRWKEEKSK